MRIVLVASQFNGEVVDRMIERALDRAEQVGAKVTTVVRVPGAFEIPLAVQTLLGRDDVDGAVAIGAVIKGETLHDEVLLAAVARALSEVSLRAGKPVGFGITGPGMTEHQANARVGNAARAVDAVLSMHDLMKGL